jgi:hypothetical protein
MPGFDKNGPMEGGPMTGGRRGLCNPANIGTGGSYGYGRGMNIGRGFRGGYGPGRGIRRGFCRGFGWYPTVYGPAYPPDQTNEVDMLKAEADYLKNALDTINKRIEDLERNPI